MSWLARSLATLGLDDVAGAADKHGNHSNPPDTGDAESSPFSRHHDSHHRHRLTEPNQPGSPARRVKEDLSEFTETLTRQFWGVAKFLAPPPPPPPPPPPSRSSSAGNRQPFSRPGPPGDVHREEGTDSSVSDDDESAIDADIIGDQGGISITGNLRTIDSQGFDDRDGQNRLVYDYDDDQRLVREAVGITDEVLAFAGNIAHHPETWLDYPIEEEEDLDDFVMSGCQELHSLAVQLLTPRLAALRIELCPVHMSESYFWKVYYVLLHSRLNKYDAELLSTPQVVEARARWMQELQKQTKKELEWHHSAPKFYEDSADSFDDDLTSMPSHIGHSDSIGHRAYHSERASSTTTIDSEYEKHRTISFESDFIEKPIVEENPAIGRVDQSTSAGSTARLLLQNLDENDEDDDDWPVDDVSGLRKSITAIPIGIDEDVSFSDLENDDFSLPTQPKGKGLAQSCFGL